MSLLEKMRGDREGWYKVSDLAAGAEIAVPSETGDIFWDEIVSITPVGREQVYDIEVEGTHNFVGNDIFAHNTYLLRANTMLAVEGEIHAEDFIVPVGSAADATSTSALGSQIPPSVLTADGKGVDLYKLATYSLAGVQALSAKVDAQDVRLVSLEDRVAKLESGAVGTATTSPFSLSTTSLASALQSFGVLISKGFAQFAKIAADNLQVGSPAHPTGITMYDKATSRPYCFRVDNGVATTTPGECADTTVASTQTIAVAPVVTTTSAVGTTATTATTTAIATASTTASTTDFRTTASTTITTTISTSSPQAIATTTTASADTTPPVVTLTGAAAMQITVGNVFTDPGATALDNVDGNLTTHIIVSGSVNTSVAGLYQLTYSATDAAGNTGSVSRVVTVLAAPPAAATSTPVI